MLEQLDVKSPQFDDEYNCIIAGGIIYALSYETSKYDNTIYGYKYPLNQEKLFEICQIKKLMYEELILAFANKALNENIIPFDNSTIKKYFGCFLDCDKNPLKNILLKRFSNYQNGLLSLAGHIESEQPGHKSNGCNLF